MKYSNPYASKTCLKRKCGKKSYARCLCKSHYQLQKIYGRPLNSQEMKVEHRQVNDFHLIGKTALMTVGNQITLIDADPRLLSLVCRKKWSLGGNGYVMSQHVYLHHLVLGKQAGKLVDHIDRDRLDNRRSNLRHVTTTENAWNFTPSGSSGHRNVHRDKKNQQWRVQVARVNFGRFDDLEEAAYVAQQAREVLYGSAFA